MTDGSLAGDSHSIVPVNECGRTPANGKYSKPLSNRKMAVGVNG
jgi:hypothetical protein